MFILLVFYHRIIQLSLQAIGNFKLGLENIGKSITSIGQVSKSTLAGVPENIRNTALAYSELEEAGVRAALSALDLMDAEIESSTAAIMAQASTLGLSGAFSALGAKIKAAATGLWTFLTTNLVGRAIAAAKVETLEFAVAENAVSVLTKAAAFWAAVTDKCRR